ncbi:MAG: hypothetical protein R3E42_11505 [Burkholderiaceae bacterium]
MHPPHPSLPNRLSPLSLGCQALSLLAMGIMAGFFWTYSINVNLAMLEMDGPVYATVQSAFNRHVRHPSSSPSSSAPPLWRLPPWPPAGPNAKEPGGACSGWPLSAMRWASSGSPKRSTCP